MIQFAGFGWYKYLSDIVNWIDITLYPCLYAFFSMRLTIVGLKINPLDITKNLEDEDPNQKIPNCDSGLMKDVVKVVGDTTVVSCVVKLNDHLVYL